MSASVDLPDLVKESAMKREAMSVPYTDPDLLFHTGLVVN